MIIEQGEVYLHESDRDALRTEPEYVKKRYGVVARTLAPAPIAISRKNAAKMLGKSLRQLYRIVKRFREQGIRGLRFQSKRPKTIPRQTARYLEDKVLAVRTASGFGPKPVADIVNESLRRENKDVRVYPSLTYNILVRNGEIERERRIQKDWRRFEWGHPNRLIQADLTEFNGVPILTMEDDHSRKGWAVSLPDKTDKTVVKGMKELVRVKYDNLLTDNGSQFSRKNAEIRKYCDDFINEKHIWTSIHHPETMGKLSAYQKGLKRFLRHMLGTSRNRSRIDKWISVYNVWYNNGRYHSGIKARPEERYSGQCDEKWYECIVKALKLEEVLTVSL